MISARPTKDPAKSGSTNLKVWVQTHDLLRLMAFKSDKVLSKRMQMIEIGAIAIQEYYDRNFKNK